MRAAIYCRVSTLEQTQNLSLETQERACRAYCQANGYDVDRVFVDAGESAKTTDRPEFTALLSHCRQRKGALHAVVVYSLTRFSRNSADHHAITTLLRGLGIALRSVTEPIDDSPSGRLMEGILAAMAQFDNDVRSERVTAGMKAALEHGRWIWPAPLGYLNGPRTGPSLVVDDDRAPLVREAFELCAAGVTGVELLQRVRDLGLTTKQGRRLSQSRLYEILRAPVYAGTIRIAKWSREQRGDFEPIVDPSTFARAQAQLSRPVPRGPLPREQRQADRPHDDLYPLRRFASCALCGRSLSGSASRGRNGAHYPAYHCSRGCVRVAKATLEQRFVDVLDQLRPHPAYWKLLQCEILDAWRQATHQARETAAAARKRVTELEQKLTRLDDAFIYRQAIDEQTYYVRRDKLREAIALETMAATDATTEALDVDAMLSFAEHTLEHAGALWWAETSTARRIALQWALFPTGIRCGKNGVLEPPVSCLEFFELQPRDGADFRMVDRPASFWNRAIAGLTRIYGLKAA